MARKGSKKPTNRRQSSSESSSNSESSEKSSSSESSESEDDDRQAQRRGTQKRQTQVRKQTVRKPTAMIKRQGTLNHIGKSGRSQEEIDVDDDFNMNQQRGGRKPTQIRGSESTAEFKRSGQRGMTKVQVQSVISNLENELVIEKVKQEQLQKEKEQNDKLARNEMNNLHQEKMKLLQQANQKKTHIESIQKKLVEHKSNNVDIISTKTKNKNLDGLCLNLLSNISQFFFDSYLLSTYSYRMANYFDNKVYEHFAFISYFYNSSLLSFFILLYLLITQIVNNSSKFSGLSLFFSFSFDGNIAAFLLLCLFFMLAQNIMLFIKYDKYKCKRVREVARYTSKINLFRLVISEYNWKIQNRSQLEKIQLAFFQRASFILNQQNTGNNNRLHINQINYSQIAFRFLGLTLSLGIVIGQIIGIKYFFQEGNIDTDNFYLRSAIQGIVCSSICIIGSGVTQLFHSFEQYKGLFLKQLRYFALQIIPCCYILLVKTLLLFQNKYSIPSYLNVDTFLHTTFSCPNEQLGYDLIIFMLTYAFFAIFYTYLQILYHFISKKCSSRGSNAASSLSIKYFYYIRFRSCQQTIPFLIVFFLMICIIPLNPFIVVLNFFLFAIIFLHNYLQAKRFFLPQLDNFSSTMIKGMIIKLLAFSIILGTIYQIIIFSLDYDLGFFVKGNEVLTCGPFNRGKSGIEEIWDHLGTFTEILLVITWKPIILFLLIFFILIAISSANQINEWQRQYQEKDNELRAIKRFYSKEVTNLEDKINYAQKNIVNMVEEDVKQLQKETNNKQQRQSDGYLSPVVDGGAMYHSPNGNTAGQNLGNGSMISTFIQNNKENDTMIQNLNIQPPNYHSRTPSLTFNIPQRQVTQYHPTSVGTPTSLTSQKQLLDTPLKNSQIYNQPSPVLVNSGMKSLFGNTLIKKN